MSFLTLSLFALANASAQSSRPKTHHEYIEVEPGLCLHVTDLGEVEPVVLIHGWQSIAFYTASFIILLLKIYRASINKK